MTSISARKEYVVSVATNNIREAIAQTGSALYDLLEQALMTADEEDESDFDQFARKTLNVIARHPEQFSGGDSQWVEAEPEDLSIAEARSERANDVGTPNDL
jgi:hypothetical protein